MVRLDVSIRDRGGQTVRGLTLPDIAVLEDGVRQAPAYLLGRPEPIALILLVDTSASLEPQFEQVRASARRLIGSLRPGDAGEVRTFSTHAGILQDLTEDRALLEDALTRLRANGSTALHDALYVVLSEPRFGTGREGRRPVVVLITDGIDTSSHVTDDQVMERARQQSALSVFCIGLLPPEGSGDVQRSRYFLRALSGETGGRAFFPGQVQAVPEIFTDIATELGARYSLGYQPSNASRDGAWRRIAVRVPSRPGLEVRHRAGYYAPRGWRFGAR